jgi:ABC-type multidrug transport system fused ATPase/permease subunit
VRLSGGQRQRVGIARAMYHDPDVLVFDEATSALDNVTEDSVLQAVEKIARTKTIIMIAHRLSTVQKCDRICVLDRGHIVATGSYDELLETSPKFREMARGAPTLV